MSKIDKIRMPDGTLYNLDVLPDQEGQTGKFLTTDGTVASWQEAQGNPDNISITTNSDNALQTVGQFQVNGNTVTFDWVGTTAEYEEAWEAGDIEPNWTCYITDDNPSPVQATFIKTPVQHTSETTLTILPNIFYIFDGTPATLNITLATPTDSTIVNEYMFQFTCGTTPTSLTLPNVRWVFDPEIESNNTHQVSVLNGIAICVGA